LELLEDTTEPEDTGKGEVAPGAKKTHAEIVRDIRQSRAHFADWVEDAKESYDFYAGKQWSTEDEAILKEQERVPVVFNRIVRTINAVCGLEVQNRQEVRYFPREMGDVALSETLTNAAKYVRDNCDAEDEESEAFEDALVCGIGWTETLLDYETDEEGAVLVERRDTFEMGVDPSAKKRNFDDKRYCFRIQSYDRSGYEARFPGKDIPTSSFFDSEESQPHFTDPVNPYNKETTDDKKKTIQVAQYQWYELQKFYIVADQTGKQEELQEDRFLKVKDQLDAQGFKYTKLPRPKRVYYQAFVTPTEALEGDGAPCNTFTFNAITAFRNRNDNLWFGLVKLMKDPQRWANKWLSQVQHILNTQAKSGKIGFETGAFKNPKQAKAEWAKPDAMVEFNAGGKEKIHQFEAARYPDGVDRLLQYAITAINDTSGVPLEVLGLTNRDQAGIVEESRKQAGVTMLAKVFDSLRRYRKEQGRTLGKFIMDYLSDGRLIRIVGKEGEQYLPLTRDKLALKYDLVVDDAPTSSSIKERTFAVLSQLLPTLLQAQVPIPPDILDYSPLPESMIQKWKSYIGEQSTNPEVQEQKALAKEAGKADVEQKKSVAMLNTAKAQKEMSDIQSGATGQQFNLEREKLAAELMLKREESQANIALKREEMTVNAALKKQEMDMKNALAFEGQKQQAEMQKYTADKASKPAVVQQMGSDEAVNNMTITLSQTILQGMEILGQAIVQSNQVTAQTIGAALNQTTPV
jgi:hypothetical protein